MMDDVVKARLLQRMIQRDAAKKLSDEARSRQTMEEGLGLPNPEDVDMTFSSSPNNGASIISPEADLPKDFVDPRDSMYQNQIADKNAPSNFDRISDIYKDMRIKEEFDEDQKKQQSFTKIMDKIKGQR